jgi:hypothetical protein
MKKIGIKFLENLEYEQFESFQYLFEFDFEYDDLVDNIVDKKVIELDIDDDEEEDRVEDIEVLSELLKAFDEQETKYELFVFDNEWKNEELKNIC